MTTVPFMSTVASEVRMASTARASAASLLPRPCSGAAARAPASVTRSSSSCGRGPCCGLGLMVSLDEAEPASRIPGLDRDGEAGLTGSGLGAGSGGALRASPPALGGLFGAALGGGGLATLSAGRLAARARGAWPRARDGFFDDPLAELTPEFPDPSHRVRRSPQRYDDGLGLDLRPLVGRFRHALGVHPDDAVVDSALLHDQGSHCGVAFTASSAGGLEPARGDDVAADKSGQGDPGTSYVGLDVRLRPDQDVSVRLDLAAEVPKHLSCALHHELAGQEVFAGQYRRFRVQPERIWAPIRAAPSSRSHRDLRHIQILPAAISPTRAAPS